jgi:Arylsulfotransferase (ASST)
VSESKQSASQGQDNFLEKRIKLRLILLFALVLSIASLTFGWIVRRVSLGSDRAGKIGELAIMIADTPSTLQSFFIDRELEVAKESSAYQPDGFSNFGTFYGDTGNFLLLSRFVEQSGRYVVQIIRLSDGVVLKTYAPDIAQINRRSRIQTPLLDLTRDRGARRYVLRHPFLTRDGGLMFQSSSPLVAVDACGRTKWTIDGIFHHSLERSADGTFWVPETLLRPTRSNVGPLFSEDALAEISFDGRLLRHISVEQLLNANGLGYLVDGRPYSDDPYHLNDIEPVLEDSPFWKRGDLFLSFRHLSLVMLYRPTTNAVVWWKQGPWRMQHDVNVLDNHRISIFDNAVSSGYQGDKVRDYSQVLIYDFKSKSLSSPYADAFRANGVKTVTEGRGTVLDDQDVFVEETNYGRILRIGTDGRARWHYITAKKDGKRYFLGWSRYLDGALFGDAVKRAMEAKCN